MTTMSEPPTMISNINTNGNNMPDNNMMHKSRPFVCQICTRAFIRQEHLKRHMRSHTNEKPFLCIFCGRCFARRDLVLRHQQKLHDTLIGTSQHHDLLSKFHNDEKILEKIEATKHVIKIEGNKQPILPTPTNPMAKTQSQLKKAAKLAERQAKKLDKLQKRQAKLLNKNHNSNNNTSAAGKLRVTSVTTPIPNELMVRSPISEQSSTSEDITPTIIVAPPPPPQNLNRKNTTQRRQRHASFSAASAFTYKQQGEHPTAQQLQDDLELMSGIPHQVGFSTPQMSATDLVDKAHENGIENIPFLTLDTINDGKSTTNFKDLFFHNDKHHNHHNAESLIDIPQSPGSKQKQQQNQQSHPVKHTHDENLAAFDSVPFLADFLTMSSSAGGVGGFFNNPDVKTTTKSNNTQVHDPNFEANAVTNLDYFQYDENLLNLSRINTNSSATSSISSRDNSRRASNVTPVVSVPNSSQQHQQQQDHDDQYLNRNNHGLYYNAHNSHSLNVVTDGEVAQNSNAHGPQPPLNRAQSDPERVLSRFITHAPFETEFLNHVDTQHFNDIGFANIQDPSFPYQNNRLTESLSRHPSNAPTSLSQQSPYSVHENRYANSATSVGNNQAQELNNNLLSRHPSNHVYENNFPNQNSTNSILVNQGTSPASNNRVGSQKPRHITTNHMDSRSTSYRGESFTPERQTLPINTAPVVIDQSNSHNNNNSTQHLDSGDAHLTINFSPSLQKHSPNHSQSQTPLPPPSQIPSRSQSRTTSVPVSHTPVHSKSHHSKPNQNDQYDLMNLFQSRQMDIYNKHLEISNFAKVLSTENLQASFHQNMAYTEKLVDDINFDNSKYRVVLFTDQYRDEIIRINGLKPDQFPATEDLNKYVNLFQDEFHRFFPFIHLHSIIPTSENHPFVLSIAMIGALYSFHSIHSVLLSNIAWFQVKELLDRQHNNYAITPLWAIQSIVLLTFIGIFSNDINVTKSMKVQLATLVELVRLTKLNEPLEHTVNPPIESDHSLLYMDDPRALQELKERYHSKVQFEKDFQYFIKAQTRIRTCHVILIVSNFFTSLTGLECIFHSIDLKCGLPCYKEILYHSPNSKVWSDNLNKFHIELDSKFSLIELSNGNGTYDNCLMYLSSGAEFYSLNSKISFKTLLSLLFSIHEKISIERSASIATPNGRLQHQLTKKDIFLRWTINSIPVISSMLKHWEILYLKNGGIFKPNHDNIETINAYPSLRLIIPLYHFVKVRENVQIAPMMRKIWKQNWNGMNHQMSKFYFDWESLREACTHALHILEFWIDTVTILEFDPQRITITTPVFSISCMISSMLILSEYLKVMELTLQKNKNGNPNNSVASHLQISDKVLWIKIYHLLDRIKAHLKQKGVTLSGKQQRSATVDIDNLSMPEIREMIRTSRLSQGMLHIGVDMLSACPVWSVGILFAQALQSRSMALEQM